MKNLWTTTTTFACRLILELTILFALFVGFCLYNNLIVVESTQACDLRLVNMDVQTICHTDGIAIRWNS